MIEEYQNTPELTLFDIISYEEILKLALENLQHKKGAYYELIKEYILSYEKLDIKMRKKIKKIIIFLQNYAKTNGKKNTIKNLNKCLNELGAVPNKNAYIRLYCACIKYSEKTITETFLKAID